MEKQCFENKLNNNLLGYTSSFSIHFNISLAFTKYLTFIYSITNIYLVYLHSLDSVKLHIKFVNKYSTNENNVFNVFWQHTFTCLLNFLVYLIFLIFDFLFILSTRQPKHNNQLKTFKALSHGNLTWVHFAMLS